LPTDDGIESGRRWAVQRAEGLSKIRKNERGIDKAFSTQRNEERKGNAKREAFVPENIIFSDNEINHFSRRFAIKNFFERAFVIHNRLS
jgi:hypothetical protein